MKTSLIAMGAAVGLLVWSSGARAQQAVEVPQATAVQPVQGVIEGQIISAPIYDYPSAPVVGSAPIDVFDPTSQPHPYSYYITFPEPARTYVGLGEVDQFPFYGQPYGRPNDRWSWTGMMGNRAAGLDRYYYQLLP